MGKQEIVATKMKRIDQLQRLVVTTENMETLERIQQRITQLVDEVLDLEEGEE